MKKIIVTEQERFDIRKKYILKESESKKLAILDGQGKSFIREWLEYATFVFLKYPKYEGYAYHPSYRWPYPAVHYDNLDKLNADVKKNPDGICYLGLLCYETVVLYGEINGEMNFEEVRFYWDETKKEGYFTRDNGKQLLPETTIQVSHAQVMDSAIKRVATVMKEEGVTDPRHVAAIIGVCSKESGLRPVKFETTHMASTNWQKRNFPKLNNKTPQEIENLKKDKNGNWTPRKFYNYVYGGTLGNTDPDDGWKYQGRGYNGITFKNIYQDVGYGENPELLGEMEHALRALYKYFSVVYSILNKKYPSDTPFSQILREYIALNGGTTVNDTSEVFVTSYQRAYDFILQNMVDKNNMLNVPGYEPVKFVT